MFLIYLVAILVLGGSLIWFLEKHNLVVPYHTTENRTENSMTLTDNIRVPLHELQADVDYLIGRVVVDGSCAPMIAASIKGKLAAVERAIIDGESACPGHVASVNDPKICGRCGVHIDSLRPD